MELKSSAGMLSALEREDLDTLPSSARWCVVVPERSFRAAVCVGRAVACGSVRNRPLSRMPTPPLVEYTLTNLNFRSWMTRIRNPR